jgi:hypothetical protein
MTCLSTSYRTVVHVHNIIIKQTTTYGSAGMLDIRNRLQSASVVVAYYDIRMVNNKQTYSNRFYRKKFIFLFTYNIRRGRPKSQIGSRLLFWVFVLLEPSWGGWRTASASCQSPPFGPFLFSRAKCAKAHAQFQESHFKQHGQQRRPNERNG